MVKGKSSTFDKIYEIVKQIPQGKVMTYGQVAEILNEELKEKETGKKITPRIVGYALHANKNPEIPCHRVVNRNGRLAPNYGFHLPSKNRNSRNIGRVREGRLGGDGWREQKLRLSREGVTFKDEMHVDLMKNLWHS